MNGINLFDVFFRVMIESEKKRMVDSWTDNYKKYGSRTLYGRFDAEMAPYLSECLRYVSSVLLNNHNVASYWEIEINYDKPLPHRQYDLSHAGWKYRVIAEEIPDHLFESTPAAKLGANNDPVGRHVNDVVASITEPVDLRVRMSDDCTNYIPDDVQLHTIHDLDQCEKVADFVQQHPEIKIIHRCEVITYQNYYDFNEERNLKSVEIHNYDRDQDKSWNLVVTRKQ